jgi:hypothetical protein
VIHLYALADRPAAVDDLVGLDDEPLVEVALPPLHAVVSEHERAPRATRERALAHAGATLEVCRRTSATPVRYGAHHADVEALRTALEGRAEDLLTSVRRVGGRLEVVVRFAAPVVPASVGAAAPVDGGAAPGTGAGAGPEGAGRAYLEERLERDRAEREARSAAADALRESTSALDAHATQVVERDGPQGPERCLLVAGERAEAVLDVARELAAADTRLVIGGPWPPYTFA